MKKGSLEEIIEGMKTLIDDSGRKIEQHGMGRVLLVEGWYTKEQLQSVVRLMDRQNEHTIETMGEIK